jgi:hypothetical protein
MHNIKNISIKTKKLELFKQEKNTKPKKNA